MSHSLTFIGKPECHLCDDARAVVSSVVAELGDVEVEERSILEDKALHDAYWEQIPVILIDGQMHTYWRVDPVRLRAALSS